MSVGALRKRLVLQRENLVDGAASWVTVASPWGEIAAVRREADVVGGGRATHVIRLRYDSAVEVKTGMRLLLGSRIFTVRGVENVGERNIWIEARVEDGGVLG